MDTLTNDPQVNEFVISRTVNAPRLLVWKVWTEGQHLKEWFGPKGVTVEHANQDFRTGGTYHYGMRMPDGFELWGKMVYKEIVPPEKLVWINCFSDPQGGVTRHPLTTDPWPQFLHTTVTFEEHAGKTTITVHWYPVDASSEEVAFFSQSHSSMQQGWTGTFERLEAYLSAL